MSLADGIPSKLPPLRPVSKCDTPQTHSVPLNLDATPYVPFTIPDPLLVDAMNPEPKDKS